MVHPGEVLKHECLDPLGMSQSDFASFIGVSLQRINEIVNGRRGVTPETAILFAQAFDTTPEFWMNLQTMYDLEIAMPKTRRIKRVAAN